jgi:iron complex transport system ATP-binding protein
MMEARNISVGYTGGKALLKGVNLQAHRGEMVALVGMNGSGKSTLLRSLLGLLPLLEGRCLLEGKPVASIDPRSRARILSYVSPGLRDPVSMKVRELVSLGRIPHSGWLGKLRPSDHALVGEVLRENHLEGLSQRPVDELSDGERQRVMIARAAAQDTPVMVLDEPGAYLDIPHKFELLRMLAMYRDRGKTVIFSTHDLALALDHADKFWVITQGVIYEGAPEDLGILGLFDSLFLDSGLKYDLERGRFQGSKEYRGSIHLEGPEGSVKAWTLHALDRLGFSEQEKGPDHKVKVDLNEGIPSWYLYEKEDRVKFNTLYDLARFLTQDG